MIENEIFDFEQLETLLKDKRHKEVIVLLKDIHHPADLVEIVNELSLNDAITLVRLLSGQRISEVLTDIDEGLRDKILEAMTDEEIAEGVSHLDTDDAADIVGYLPDNRKEPVISGIENIEHAQSIVELLTYNEDSAGGLMAKELVSVNQNWDVSTSLKEIKNQAENIKKIYSIYVVDDQYKLKGRLSIKDVLTNPLKTLIKELYIEDVKSVSVNENPEEVAMVMSKYNLDSIPVIDEVERLVGRITIDNIIDVMKEEADKDYQLAAGITSGVEYSYSVWKLTRSRLPWLLIGSMGGMGAATAINTFTPILSTHPILMIFIPLIQSTAGNVGVQSSAIVVQGIANNTLGKNFIERLFKEIGVGFINGIAITTLVLLISHIIFDININISITVAIALITVMLNAGIVGTVIPFLLNKRNIDPAVATGPFITTGADILGILIYFFIAKLILHL